MPVDYTNEEKYRKLALNDYDSFYSHLDAVEEKYKKVLNESPFI